MDGELPRERRQAGVTSAVLLGVSSVASLVGLLVYAQRLPILYPVISVAILSVVTLVLVAAAAWLGLKIWRDGARWPALVLLLWAFAKQLVPDLLYPNVLPRFIYLVATIAAVLVLVQSRAAKRTRA